MNVLGNNIRRLRESSVMSQDELAEILNCTRQTVSNYERGVSEPDLESIRKMADIFSCDINELINEENKKDRKIIDIMTAGIILVAVGVIFYFIFVGINYKHSTMGGRFNEHFKNIHGED